MLQLQENENKFKVIHKVHLKNIKITSSIFFSVLVFNQTKFYLQEEYRKFGMKVPEAGQNSFEKALLMYEIINVSILGGWSYKEHNIN